MRGGPSHGQKSFWTDEKLFFDPRGGNRDLSGFQKRYAGVETKKRCCGLRSKDLRGQNKAQGRKEGLGVKKQRITEEPREVYR